MTKFPQRLHDSQPNQLIKRGSQTTYNRKLDYHDSYTLCKGSAPYPRVVISSLANWLEEPPFYHSYTFFGAWPRDHYMPLQRATTGICHALLRIPQQRPRLQCWGFPSKDPSCTMWFRHFHKLCHKVWHKEWCQSPLNRARHITYSIPN
jgi:hypothetical protein